MNKKVLSFVEKNVVWLLLIIAIISYYIGVVAKGFVF